MQTKTADEIELSRKGVHAHGPATIIIAIGIAAAAVLYGAGQVSGLSTNEKEHNIIKTRLQDTDNKVIMMDKKLDTILMFVKQQNNNCK